MRSSTPISPVLPESWARALFAKLRAIYGSRFVDGIGGVSNYELAIREWQQALGDLKPAQIRTAIDYCRDNLQWPPSIAEFRKAAHGGGEWQHTGGAYRITNPARLLAANPARPETVQEAMAEIRRALGAD